MSQSEPDTDLDGLTNAQEQQLGTNPEDVDLTMIFCQMARRFYSGPILFLGIVTTMVSEITPKHSSMVLTLVCPIPMVAALWTALKS